MKLDMVGPVAFLRMNAGKANAINPRFLGKLNDLLDGFDRSGAAVAVLIGYDRFFSAGLDLVTLHRFDRRDMTDTLSALHHTLLRIYACPLPVVAAMNGHAIAAGYGLALTADHRVLADRDVRVGLNETQIGVGLPLILTEMMRNAMPAQHLRTLTLEGRLCDAREALASGMVDRIAQPEHIERAALEKARELAAIPPAAYTHVKRTLRRPAIDTITRDFEMDAEAWLETWFSETAIRARDAAVATMGR